MKNWILKHFFKKEIQKLTNIIMERQTEIENLKLRIKFMTNSERKI